MERRDGVGANTRPQWRYRHNNEVHGPVPAAEILWLYHQGALTAASQVARPGSEAWYSLSKALPRIEQDAGGGPSTRETRAGEEKPASSANPAATPRGHMYESAYGPGKIHPQEAQWFSDVLSGAAGAGIGLLVGTGMFFGEAVHAVFGAGGVGIAMLISNWLLKRNFSGQSLLWASGGAISGMLLAIVLSTQFNREGYHLLVTVFSAPLFLIMMFLGPRYFGRR